MVLGVSIERTIIIAWALSIAITSIGGILLAMASGGAGFTIESVGIIIFAAVVFGGLDSIPGAFLGALVVGVLQEYGGATTRPRSSVQGPGRSFPWCSCWSSSSSNRAACSVRNASRGSNNAHETSRFDRRTTDDQSRYQLTMHTRHLGSTDVQRTTNHGIKGVAHALRR